MGPNFSPTGALARDYTVSRATKEALSGQYFCRLEAALVLGDFVDPDSLDERVLADNSGKPLVAQGRLEIRSLSSASAS